MEVEQGMARRALSADGETVMRGLEALWQRGMQDGGRVWPGRVNRM
jgi:hypothetical protein